MNCFTKLWHSAVIASMVIAPLAWAKVTIYMCGDSTMQDVDVDLFRQMNPQRVLQKCFGMPLVQRAW